MGVKARAPTGLDWTGQQWLVLRPTSPSSPGEQTQTNRNRRQKEWSFRTKQWKSRIAANFGFPKRTDFVLTLPSPLPRQFSLSHSLLFYIIFSLSLSYFLSDSYHVNGTATGSAATTNPGPMTNGSHAPSTLHSIFFFFLLFNNHLRYYSLCIRFLIVVFFFIILFYFFYCWCEFNSSVLKENLEGHVKRCPFVKQVESLTLQPYYQKGINSANAEEEVEEIITSEFKRNAVLSMSLAQFSQLILKIHSLHQSICRHIRDSYKLPEACGIWIKRQVDGWFTINFISRCIYFSEQLNFFLWVQVECYVQPSIPKIRHVYWLLIYN